MSFLNFESELIIKPEHCIRWKPSIIELFNKRLANSQFTISIGEIPVASEIQTGIPFSDGFQNLISPTTPPLKSSYQTQQPLKQISITHQRSSGTSTPSTRRQSDVQTTSTTQIQTPLSTSSSHQHKNNNQTASADVKPIPRELPTTSSKTALTAASKTTLTAAPMTELTAAPMTELTAAPMTELTAAPMIAPVTVPKMTSVPAPTKKTKTTITQTSTTSTPTTSVNSSMSRKREPWLIQLQIKFSQRNNNKEPGDPASIEANYPQVGDSFSSVEKFKEACLWASWTAGHDMHVKNHYKTENWERCVFTCRYDRFPPKGYNCPFKIIATRDKAKKESSDPFAAWKVISCHLTHQNHQNKPGFYDPTGKRSYRKRRADGSLEDISQQVSDSEFTSKRRRRSSLNHNVNQAGNEDESKVELVDSISSLPLTPQLSNAQLDQPSQLPDPDYRPRRSLAKYDPIPLSSLVDGLQ